MIANHVSQTQGKLDSAVELLLAQQACKKKAGTGQQESFSKPESTNLASIFTSVSQQRGSQQLQGKEQRKANTPIALKSRSISQVPSSSFSKPRIFSKPTSQPQVRSTQSSIQSDAMLRSEPFGSSGPICKPIDVPPTSMLERTENPGGESVASCLDKLVEDQESKNATQNSKNKEAPACHLESRTEKPLADRMRPAIWSEFVGQSQARDILMELSSSGYIPSIILWGPPGDAQYVFKLHIMNNHFLHYDIIIIQILINQLNSIR